MQTRNASHTCLKNTNRALLVGMMLMPVPALAGWPADNDLTCRGAVARVDTVLGLVGAEVFVANAPGTPCEDDHALLLDLEVVGDASVRVAQAHTTSRDCYGDLCTVAQGLVIGASADLAAIVEVDTLFSRASVVGVDGTCTLSADSFLGSVYVAGIEIDVGHEPKSIHLPGLGTLHLNHTSVSGDTIVQRAVWLETSLSLLADVVLGEAIAGFGSHDECEAPEKPEKPGRPTKPPRKPEKEPIKGWMTGGGKVTAKSGDRVTYGFRLGCTDDDGPHQFQINWQGHSFHLEQADRVSCRDTGINPSPPTASFDTHVGAGVGRLDGTSGYKVEWKLIDAGEPGTEDAIALTIRDPYGAIVVQASAQIEGGNHQAH